MDRTAILTLNNAHAHARLGFTPLADRTLPGGKVVRYFERRLLAA